MVTDADAYFSALHRKGLWFNQAINRFMTMGSLPHRFHFDYDNDRAALLPVMYMVKIIIAYSQQASQMITGKRQRQECRPVLMTSPILNPDTSSAFKPNVYDWVQRTVRGRNTSVTLMELCSA